MPKCKIDRELVQTHLNQFAGNGWLIFKATRFIKGNGARNSWAPLKKLEKVGGVYAFLAPCCCFARNGSGSHAKNSTSFSIRLHCSNQTRGEQEREHVHFHFSMNDLQAVPHQPGQVVLYVGKTRNLKQRFQFHFTLSSSRKYGNQVKSGLLDMGLCGLPQNLNGGVEEYPAESHKQAINFMLANFRIAVCKLDGASNTANRDALELKLAARYLPPFNIKAER